LARRGDIVTRRRTHFPVTAGAAVGDGGRALAPDLEGIACFVTLVQGVEPNEDLKKALRDHVAREIGTLARPDSIRFTESLPKTRSGKIMRRLLRDIAGGRQTTGDTTTLEDYTVLAKLREEEEG
jgi:acetyl-CoA synthetase